MLDLLCTGFLAIGIEWAGTKLPIPWSHGLFMSAVWSGITGGIAFLFWRNSRTSSVIGLLVFSHWVLDFISHSHDLPLLFNGSPLVGLGIGSSPAIKRIMEAGLLGVGINIYLASRKVNSDTKA